MIFVFNLHSTDFNLKTISESTKVGTNSNYILFIYFFNLRSTYSYAFLKEQDECKLFVKYTFYQYVQVHQKGLKGLTVGEKLHIIIQTPKHLYLKCYIDSEKRGTYYWWSLNKSLDMGLNHLIAQSHNICIFNCAILLDIACKLSLRILFLHDVSAQNTQ